jgi:hypothetical protein
MVGMWCEVPFDLFGLGCCWVLQNTVRANSARVLMSKREFVNTIPFTTTSIYPKHHYHHQDTAENPCAMATPDFPTRQLVSTPWDQLLAETETEEYEED